jgi:hypothetical protein
LAGTGKSSSRVQNSMQRHVDTDIKYSMTRPVTPSSEFTIARSKWCKCNLAADHCPPSLGEGCGETPLVSGGDYGIGWKSGLGPRSIQKVKF